MKPHDQMYAYMRQGGTGNVSAMEVLLALFILAALFIGLGFAVHLLWILAVAVVLAWIIVAVLRAASRGAPR